MSEPDPEALWANLRERFGSDLDPRRSLTLDPRELATEADVVLEASDTPLEPLRLEGERPAFRLQSLLGQGGMGEVSLAQETSLHRDVALKRSSASDAAQRALLREAHLIGALEHPNIVPIHRLGVDEAGRPVLVMKRIAGASWQGLLDDPHHPIWGALPADRLLANLEIFTQVCRALHYAHSRGVLHRDVKPDNVMVGEFGEVYLVDWGLGLRLEEREVTPPGVVGTIAYMAPEMLHEPRGLSERTDVYLLGATLHQVLTGRQRHEGASSYNVMVQAMRSKPVEYGDEVPAELGELCNRATAREPEARPASPAELRRAVEAFLEHRGSRELSDRTLEELARFEAAPTLSDEASRATFAACRFGFARALEAWPENTAARTGLQRCLELAIEDELRRDHLTLAPALLLELPEPRPELAARVAEAEERVGDERARLQALEADLDLGGGAQQRASSVVALVVVLAGSTLGLAGFVLTGRLSFSYPVALAFGGLIGAGLLGVAWVGRDWLRATRPNRTLTALVGAAWALAILNVLLCWAYSIPGWTLILYVGLILTGLALQGALLVDRRLWPPALVSAGACLSGLLFPNLDPLLTHVVVGLAIGAYLTLIWWRQPLGEDPA